MDIISNIPAADAAEIYYLTWGVKPNFTTPQLKSATRQTNSKLGAPYWNTDANGREYFLPVQIGVVDLPAPFISTQSDTLIVETPMVAGDGSVKELITQESRKLRVRGICYDTTGNWPEEQINLLMQLDNVKQTYEIENVLAAIAGITHVVIARLSILETKGKRGMVPYEMELIDDKPFNLIIT